MASNFRVFWRKQRQIQRLPQFNEAGTAPPAPPGEPVSAWTPYFKRTDNATNRRVPEENPHNPEHPETPPPPRTAGRHSQPFITFRQLQPRRLSPLELNQYPAPILPGEPVSAWTPYFKRTNNATHRRVPEENPHNPEYPATPAAPFFITSVDPATSIKRRDIRRQRIPSPFHYDKPLTTRITHLTANVLYGQGPPAARITHLTAQVIYRAPRSQGHPETTPPKKGKKKKWGHISGDSSTARRLTRIPPLDVFTPTPPIPIVAPATPALKANHTAFQRQIQSLPPLWEYPPTPAVIFPFAALDLLLRANTIAFQRQRQALPQLDQRPVTPPGFRWPRPPFPTFKVEFVRTRRELAHNPDYPATPAGFRWPRPPMPTFKVSFTRSLQPLAHNPAYPPTPPGFFEGFFPAPIRLKRIPITYGREAQVPLELDERPPTPLGFFDGQWPSHKPAPTFRIEFTRALQAVLIPPVYPETPVSADDYPGLTPALRANRVDFTRTLQALELNEYPETPPGFFEGFFPAPVRLKRIPLTYHRESQSPLELNERPPTPAGFFDGFYPGSARVEANRISFDRSLQKIPELDRYKPPPVSDENYAGYTPVAKFSVSANRDLISVLNPHVYPATPPGFRWPRPPPPTFKVSFKRTIQTLELDERPPTPPAFFEGFFPAPFRVKRIPTTYGREAQRVLDPHVYPPTPPGFFEGHWPATKLPPTFKVAFVRDLQTLPELDQFTPLPGAVEDFAAYTPVPTIRRRDTKRTLQQPLELNEHPPTPLVIVPFVTPSPQRNTRHSGRYF